MPHRRTARATALAAAALAVVPATAALLNALAWSEARALALQSFASSLLLALLAWAGAELSVGRSRDRLGLAPGRLPAATLVTLTVGLVAVSHGLDGALRLFGLRATSSLAELDRLLAGLAPGELAIVFVGLVLAAPIGEELLFRGLLQRGLERRLGPLAGVVLASAAFGAVHGDPVHAPAAFALGLYLGAITLWSGSVRAAIGAHAANNAVAVLEAAGGLAPVASGWALALGAALGLPPLWLARRQARRANAAPVSRGDLQHSAGSADL